MSNLALLVSFRFGAGKLFLSLLELEMSDNNPLNYELFIVGILSKLGHGWRLKHCFNLAV